MHWPVVSSYVTLKKMKRCLLVLTLTLLSGAAIAAENLIGQTQSELKKQGFYYGEVTGKENLDTTAAIKRFQIRNALEVTGSLNQETLEALGFKGPAAGTKVPDPQAEPSSKPQPRRPANLRKDE